jgi:nucleoside-diphosphate-sugar epimerase
MRILLAGATGVLGRATLPHLKTDYIVGLTRTPEKLQLLRALGAEGVVCDVYDSDELLRVAREVRPQIVVNFLTDLSAGIVEANNRLRREGNKNLVNAAKAAAARRLVIESVAFPLERAAADALEQMEQTALDSPLDVLILRFGRFWGPGTWYQEQPEKPAIHIDEAGARAAKLLTSAPPGTYVIKAT